MGIKLLLVGPVHSGKSYLANLLGNKTVNMKDHKYTETGKAFLYHDLIVGCRVISTNVREVEVDIWDVSGDLKYDRYWPAILSDVDAIIYVLDGSKRFHQSQLASYVGWFGRGVPKDNCIVLQLLHDSSSISESKHDNEMDLPNNFDIYEERVNSTDQNELISIFKSLVLRIV